MMAFDLIPRQMVAFHGEGILQTKHFHHDDIEGGNVQPSHSPSPLFGRRPNPETHDVSKYAQRRTETSSELAQRQSQSIATSLSPSLPAFFCSPNSAIKVIASISSYIASF